MKITFGQQTTKVKQLADLISQEISMGTYKSDSALPSINQLSRNYHVSRDTVFKAFIDLKDRGMIDSTPGKGYYELLDWLSDYLIDYTVKDENGESISIGEKRIGAPTIITVQNGVPVSSWKLSMVENAEFPDNAYTRWSQETQEIVSESLHQYFAEEA